MWVTQTRPVPIITKRGGSAIKKIIQVSEAKMLRVIRDAGGHVQEVVDGERRPPSAGVPRPSYEHEWH